MLGNFEVLQQQKSIGKWKTEAQGKFLNPFTVCSLCRRKFVTCQFVDEEKTEVIRLQKN
jgi:hypothetical protein